MNDGEARRDSSTWLQILHQGPQGRRGGRGAAKGLRSGEGGTNRIDIAAGASGDFHHAYPLGSPSLLSPSTLCCRSSPPPPCRPMHQSTLRCRTTTGWSGTPPTRSTAASSLRRMVRHALTCISRGAHTVCVGGGGAPRCVKDGVSCSCLHQPRVCRSASHRSYEFRRGRWSPAPPLVLSTGSPFTSLSGLPPPSPPPSLIQHQRLRSLKTA